MVSERRAMQNVEGKGCAKAVRLCGSVERGRRQSGWSCSDAGLLPVILLKRVNNGL
jgi:hypothetical protein